MNNNKRASSKVSRVLICRPEIAHSANWSQFHTIHGFDLQLAGRSFFEFNKLCSDFGNVSRVVLAFSLLERESPKQASFLWTLVKGIAIALFC